MYVYIFKCNNIPLAWPISLGIIYCSTTDRSSIIIVPKHGYLFLVL